MNATQSKQLKAKDRVLWDNDPNICGTVVETGYAAVKIQWDDGQLLLVQHNNENVLREISRATPNPSRP
jgi:hypothetical protein